MARLLSIQVARPRTMQWQGEAVTTSIFKEHITGSVAVRPHNVDGDQQSDLKAHGGVNKAVYVYPVEHYAYWRAQRAQLPETPMAHGMFGENLTIEGLLEDAAHVGDLLRIGSAEFRVSEPRFPCYKLGLKFGRADMVKKFLASRRSGFYLTIVRAGVIAPGDAIEHGVPDPTQATIADFVRAYAERDNAQALQRVIQSEAIDIGWRNYFAEHLAKTQVGRSRKT